MTIEELNENLKEIVDTMPQKIALGEKDDLPLIVKDMFDEFRINLINYLSDK